MIYQNFISFMLSSIVMNNYKFYLVKKGLIFCFIEINFY